MTSKIVSLIAFFVLFSKFGAADKPDAGSPLRQLRFSWDGIYILAQDDSEIVVLGAEPFRLLFRIPAANATRAQFTPDSAEVEFISQMTRSTEVLAIAHGSARLECWNVRDHALARSSALPALACGSSELTLDGRMLACVDLQGALAVFDVASSQKILGVKKFSRPLFTWIGPYRYDYPNDLGAARMQFSPDGHFLIAIPSGDQPTVSWDAWQRRSVKLKGLISLLRSGRAIYTFLAPDRILLSRYFKWGKRQVVTARIVSFPEGQVLSTSALPWGPELHPSADPHFVIVDHPYRPELVSIGFASLMAQVATPGAAAVELATGEMIISDTPALDVYGNKYVAEVRPGEVGLYERGKGLQATVVLHQK